MASQWHAALLLKCKGQLNVKSKQKFEDCRACNGREHRYWLSEKSFYKIERSSNIPLIYEAWTANMVYLTKSWCSGWAIMILKLHLRSTRHSSQNSPFTLSKPRYNIHWNNLIQDNHCPFLFKSMCIGFYKSMLVIRKIDIFFQNILTFELYIYTQGILTRSLPYSQIFDHHCMYLQ